MLKNFETLVKIAEFELNEKRKQLAEVQRRRDSYLEQIKKLEAEVKYESDNLQKNKDAKDMFKLYLDAVNQKKKNLTDEANKLLPKIDKLTDQVSDRFREVKKYETVLENKKAEIENEERKKSQLELDEIAIIKHNSNKGSG